MLTTTHTHRTTQLPLLRIYMSTQWVSRRHFTHHTHPLNNTGASSSPLTEREKVAVLVFLIHCFQSLEERMVRRVRPFFVFMMCGCTMYMHTCVHIHPPPHTHTHTPLILTSPHHHNQQTNQTKQVVLRLSSLPLWEALSPGRRTLELEAFPQLKRHWQHHASQKVCACTLHARYD